MTRTDHHRPSEIVPADYRWLGCFYQGASDDMYDAYRADFRELEDNLRPLGIEFDGTLFVGSGYAGNYAARGTCDLCGTAFAHGSVYVHEPTGDVIAVGHICAADTMLPGQDRAARVRALAEKAAKQAATAAKNAKLRDAFRAERPDVVAVFDEWAEVDSFVGDVYRRWHANPEKTLSEKQIEALLKVPARRAEWAARDAAKAEAEAARLATASPVPDDGKRHTVTGTIVSERTDETDFGTVYKMLIVTTDGYKLWGSKPRSLESSYEWDDEGQKIIPGAGPGDVVRFAARLERSDKDEFFGFYSRPTKAEIIERAEVQS